MTVAQKEFNIIQCLNFLQQMRDEIRAKDSYDKDIRIPSDNFIPIIHDTLKSILEAEKEERRLVDIFVGIPGYEQEYLEPINYNAESRHNIQGFRKGNLRKEDIFQVSTSKRRNRDSNN